MKKQTHSDLSREQYLSRAVQKSGPKPIFPNLSAFSEFGTFTVSGIIHCIQTQLQSDVKKGLPIPFDFITSTMDGVSLQKQSAITMDIRKECIALLWYTACVSPQFGTTASLEVMTDGAIVAGSSAYAQSSYQIGAQMTLSALTVMSLHKRSAQAFELINTDSTADICHASLVMLLLDGAAPPGFSI